MRDNKPFNVVAMAIEATLRRHVLGVAGRARTLGDRLEATLGVVLMATPALFHKVRGVIEGRERARLLVDAAFGPHVSPIIRAGDLDAVTLGALAGCP